MELKRTGPETVVITAHNGTRILFSYGEPVAMYDVAAMGWLRVDGYVSRTTERHIAGFLSGARAKEISREEIHRRTRELR